MKAITLWQPPATLVAKDLKHYETRPWQPGYRGPIAIHAAKALPRQGWCREKLDDKIFREVVFGGEEVPTGVILAVTTIEEVTLITTDNVPGWPERSFGDYTPGRYMWRLGRPTLLVEPIPARGLQGLWEWKPKCQSPGCAADAFLCELYDDKDNRDLGWFYCPEHAAQNGFCSCCGNFYSGTSEMERWSGKGAWYCDNCRGDNGDLDEYDEELDLWADYPGDLLPGNIDFNLVEMS
ncbi:MAG: hypothetical protein JW900_07365 [Anaerolineae bacterium]|nr:hypothetical protein [Anaerolineae bacterium]